MAIANKETLKVEDLMETLSDDGNLEESMICDGLDEMTELSQGNEEEMEHQDEISTIEAENNHVIIQQNPAVPKVEVLQTEIKHKTVVPPLRPLTIAPKPTKVPISFKTVPGQQLLLVQGTSPGQPIKLISPGQGINLSNLSLAKTVTLKTNKITGNTISLVQPKQLIMKKLVTQTPKGTLTKTIDGKPNQQIVVVQKGDTQQIKLVQTSTGGIMSPTPAKTLTLAQAQQMGLLTGTKLVPQSGTKQLIFNKNQAKTIKIVPQLKQPTKILPAPQNQINKVPPRIILKPAGTNTSVLPGQLIQMGGQTINTGQLHQINIPGKGMQFIKFVTTSQAEASTATGTTFQTIKAGTGITTKVIPVTSSTSTLKSGFLSEIKPTNKQTNFSPKVSKARTVNVNLSATTTSQMVVLPLGYTTKTSTTQKIAIPAIRTLPVVKKSTSHLLDAVVPSSNQTMEQKADTNGIRPRKPCNCTKSQCLKLYCDCFANGEFCFLCNCNNCHNNIEHEENRQRAIKNCLERNPNAFRPKIGKARDITSDSAIRKHTKGCNCKRSGCLKNYCECYEAKIACSSNCRCLGCRNIEEQGDKKNSRLADVNFMALPQLTRIHPTAESPNRNKKTSPRQSYNYITPDIIEATSHCLLGLSRNALEGGVEEELVKKQIIEEYGRCLKQIIDCSIGKSNS